jgi:hypothetical protein
LDDLFDSRFNPRPTPPEPPADVPPESPPVIPPPIQEPHAPPGSWPRQPVARRRPLDADLARLARLLYSHNPFYCISALLVLWGLTKSFRLHGATPQPELLLAGLAGYSLLLALVGCLLIRAGQLWEDIRTILLSIVIIFMASSMSFDEVLAAGQSYGPFYYLGGLAFAVAVSEVVLRAIRLRLPALYRLPYYATLALFFLYPLLLAPWHDDENALSLRWRLAGFAPLSGLITLTLLPAVRRGADYVRDNGSPWQWPWYPWPLFVILAVGVGMRTYSLCVSFHPSQGPATMFEPFFLVPLLLGITILMLEIALRSRRPALIRRVLAMPVGLLWLASWTFPGTPPAISLRGMLLAACGCSPLYLTLLAMIALYAVATLRRAPGAGSWLSMAIAMLVVISPTSEGLFGPWSLHAWPLAPLAALELYAAIRRRSGWHWLAASACPITAASILWPEEIGELWYGAIPLHLFLASMLLIGALLRDPFSLFLQRAGFTAMVLAAAFVLSAGPDFWSISPRPALLVYPGLLGLVAFGYGYWLRSRWYCGWSIVMLIAWVATVAADGYGGLRKSVAGLDELAGGLACLAAGLIVSLWKLGVPQAWWKGLLAAHASPALHAGDESRRGSEPGGTM